MYPNNQEKQLLKFCLCFGFLNLLFIFGLVALGVFTPFTAMLTTGIAELVFTITQAIYARKKIGVSLNLFEGSNKNYFILSLLFIPISLLIRLFNLSYWLNIIVIILVCVLLYVWVLYIKKDDNLLLNRLMVTYLLKLLQDMRLYYDQLYQI